MPWFQGFFIFLILENMWWCMDKNGNHSNTKEWCHEYFINLNEWTTYVVEDLGGTVVNKYKYTLNYNPKMWLPVDVETVD